MGALGWGDDVRLSIVKTIIIVAFHVATIIIIFNKYPDPVDYNLFVEKALIPLPKINIYQQYVENIVFASGLSIVFNAFCARIEMGEAWDTSSFICNRWTFIYAILMYSGAALHLLMFLMANSIILWRIYQIEVFLLVGFLDLDRLEVLYNYFVKAKK